MAPCLWFSTFTATPTTLPYRPVHADFTEMDDTAEAYGFYVAYPEGLHKAFHAGGGCCADATADDLGLARDLVDYVAAKRVHGSGSSPCNLHATG